jgi:hypothetical protein
MEQIKKGGISNRCGNAVNTGEAANTDWSRNKRKQVGMYE